MQNEEIINKINSFPYWINQFDLKGNLTPVPKESTIEGARQRKSYFLDPLIKFCGGSLEGKRILDIGCNSGYWALQAIEAGCEYIVGLDGRQMHIDQANFVFEVKEIDKSRYEFHCGNVYDLNFKDFGEFDIVICLGFFHHMSKHVQLIEKISEVSTDLLLLETRVTRLPGKYMQILHEPTDHYANSLDYTLTMCPSKKAVLSMTEQFGYESIILEPQAAHKAALLNYKNNRRLAFIASKKSDLSLFPAEVKKITLFSEFCEVLSMGLNLVLSRLGIRK